MQQETDSIIAVQLTDAQRQLVQDALRECGRNDDPLVRVTIAAMANAAFDHLSAPLGLRWCEGYDDAKDVRDAIKNQYKLIKSEISLLKVSSERGAERKKKLAQFKLETLSKAYKELSELAASLRKW